jgi:HSP20 family protein
MWAEACELLDQAERLHRQYFRLGATGEPARHWEPPVDVVTTPHEVRITVALPGVNAEHVQVSADSGVLIVDAVRPPPPRGAGIAIQRLEIPYGRFRRRISLPPGRYELLEQTYTQGCLELLLAKH